MSLKSRLVLLHTGLMAFVVCVVLALLFSMSSHEILANAENMLEERVADTVEDIEYENGRLDFDSDLMTLEQGIYLSMIKTASICFMDGFPMVLLMTFLLKMGISERSQREKLTIMFLT